MQQIKTQEYFSVKELSQKTGLQKRTIIQRLNQLRGEKDESLLFKNKNGMWQIHQLLEKYFKRKKQSKNKWISYTIDPADSHYSIEEIHKIMEIIFIDLWDFNLEMNYVIEKKKSNLMSHLHGYTNSKSRNRVFKAIRDRFPLSSVYIDNVYDLNGWKSYIQKESSIIRYLNTNNVK
jgi:hypothetical protein